MRTIAKLFLLMLIMIMPYWMQAQQPGFKAAIGFNTFTVKNGDVLHVCKNESILYTSTAANYNTLDWRYDNGSVNTTSSNSFSVNYPVTGSKFYIVQILNKGTASADSSKVTVVVSDKDANLKAAFNYTPISVSCGSSIYSFDAASSTGSGLSYYWDFGDGEKTTGQKVTHSFNSAVGSGGTSAFTLMLTVVNQDGCSDVSTQNLTVNNIPDTKLDNDPANADTTHFGNLITFCKSETLTNYDFIFINAATTSPNVSDTIDWGDGSPKRVLTSWALNDTLKHNYTPGNHILTRISKGVNGCIRTEKFNVFLGKNSGSSFGTVDNVTDYCVGEAKLFKITPGFDNPPGTQYILHVDDCSQDSVFYDLEAGKEYIVPHYFLTPQCENSCGFVPFYTAHLYTVNPCKTTELTYPNLNVYGKPKARIAGDSAGCSNSTISFSNTSDFGSVYQSGVCTNTGVQAWKISPLAGATYDPAQAGSVNNQPGDWTKWTNGSEVLDVTFNQPGIYYITLYISNKKCGIDSITQTVCIQNKPASKFTFANLDADACLSDTITFQNSTVNGACISNKYEWNILSSDPSNCSNGDAPVYISGNSTASSPQVWFKQPGNYRVQLKAFVSDVCYDTTSLPLTIKGKPVVSLNAVNNICVGNFISPSATAQDCYSGETLKYNWTFTNGSPSSSTQLNPGNIVYNQTNPQNNIMFSASNSCGTSTATQTFEVVSKPVANAGADLSLCDGDSKTIGINTGNYTYSWSPATGLSDANSATPLVILPYTGTSADTITYTLHVSAGSNCDSFDVVKVIVKPSPKLEVSSSAPNICQGGGVQITASGANTYSWSPASGLNTITGPVVIMSPAASAVYTVTGMLTNGCTSAKQVNVTVNKAAVAEAGNPDSVCNGSSITIGTNTGSFNYSWFPANDLSDPNSAVTTLTPKNYIKDTTVKYYLTANAGAGCSATDSVLIKIKKSPVVSINPTAPEICIGNSVNVTAQGADSYQWSPNTYINTTTGNAVIITPPATTDYQITGSFNNGCTNTLPFKTIVNPDAIAAFTPDVYTSCAPYNLKDVIQTASHPEANSNYAWHILYKNKDSVQQYLSAQPPDYTLTIPGDSVVIYLIALSKYGCENDTTSKVIFKAGDAIKASFSKSITGGCEPAHIFFTNTSSIVNSSVTYTWIFGNGKTSNAIQPDSIEYTTLPESRDTTFYVSLIAKNKCGIDSVKDSVKIKPLPVARFGSNDSTTGCSPYSITFRNTSAGNVSDYYWDFDDGVAFHTTNNNPVSHTYTSDILDTFNVKLITQNSCGIDSLIIPVVVAPNTIKAQVTTYGNDLYGCAPHIVNFVNNTTGALTSLWNFGDNTGESLPGNILNVSHTYNTPGTYKVSINFDNGCSKAVDTQTVNIYAPAEAAFTVSDSTNNIFCFGDTVHLNITKQTGDYNYLYWGDDNLFYSPPLTSHYYDSLGIYTIRLISHRINAIGVVCADTAVAKIAIAEKPLVGTATPQQIDCFTDEVSLSAYGGVYYEWLPSTGLSDNHISNPIAHPSSTTTYTVKITAASGCVQQKPVTVVVNRQPGQNEFLMPSAFTPNGDGLNDCFRLKYSGNVTEYTLRIFSRWGNLLFQTNNVSECWDGTYKKNKMPAGTYIFTMDVKSECAANGKDGWLNKKGTVVLIR